MAIERYALSTPALLHDAADEPVHVFFAAKAHESPQMPGNLTWDILRLETRHRVYFMKSLLFLASPFLPTKDSRLTL